MLAPAELRAAVNTLKGSLSRQERAGKSLHFRGSRTAGRSSEREAFNLRIGNR